MTSLPERRPIIRGEQVYLRAPERDDLPTFVRWFNVSFEDGHAESRRSYEKAGFTHEGTMRRAHFARGEHHDVHVMSLLRDEWMAMPHRRSWELD